MAYQPKSYRKFIATAATATMVAGAVAPLATFAAETSFKDATGIYKTPVEYLVEKGFVNGVSKDEFGVSAKVKRGDAAVILSKALGLYATQAPDAGFTDLAAKYKDAVNPLKAAGIISGKTATEFKPDDFLTRGEVAIILAKAYKLEAKNQEALPFTDVNKNYAPFVKALVDNKVANGTTATTFGTASDITRGQMAIFLYNAIQAKPEVDKVAPEIKLTGDAAVSVDFGAEYKDAGATATDNVDKTVDVKWEIKDAAGKVVDKIDTKVPGKYTITYTAKDAAGNEAKAVTREVTVKEDPIAKVESVSAINAKQLVVTFNKSVDKNTVFSNVTNGTLATGAVTVGRTTSSSTSNENVSSVTGKLSEDGKSLTLTAANATYFNGTYAVTVGDSVKSTDGKALKAYAGTVTADDTTAPTISNVSYDTITNEVVVTLSEPVVAVPDVVRLNGNPVSGVTFVTGSDNKQIKFTKPSTVAAGSTASIYVAGAVDANDNILTPYNGNVTFTNDASALSVASITQVGSNVAKVVFNKSLASNDTTIDGALSVIQDGAVLPAGNVTAALDTTDTSNKTVLVTFAGTAPNYFYGTASSKTLTFVFGNNVITDVFGKTLAATTQNVTMTKDATGPKAVSAKLGVTDGTIEVTFDEDIAASGTAANIVLRKDGVALNTVASAVRKTGDNKTLVITAASTDLTAGKLPAGTYTVRLESGAIADVNTNSNDVQTVSVTKGSTTTDLTSNITNTTATPNQFEVAYSEDVTASSALNLANYKLDGVALPTGTDIYFKNGAANRTVVIKLPTDSINIGSTATPANARLAVSGVQTSTGKTVVANSGTVQVKDNTAPVLQSASLIGNNIIKLSFNENVAATFADLADILDDVTIADGTTAFVAGDATATSSVSGKDVIITVTPGTTSNWSTLVSGSSLTVKTLGTGDGDIKDVNGVTAKANVTVAVTK